MNEEHKPTRTAEDDWYGVEPSTHTSTKGRAAMTAMNMKKNEMAQNPPTSEELAQWQAVRGILEEDPWHQLDRRTLIATAVVDEERVDIVQDDFWRLIAEVERLRKESRCACGEPMNQLSASCVECWYGGE